MKGTMVFVKASYTDVLYYCALYTGISDFRSGPCTGVPENSGKFAQFPSVKIPTFALIKKLKNGYKSDRLRCG